MMESSTLSLTCFCCDEVISAAMIEGRCLQLFKLTAQAIMTTEDPESEDNDDYFEIGKLKCKLGI